MASYTLLEFDQLDSTSDFLKENHAYFPHMTFIRAGYQLKGRGQFDRTWQSNKDENLLFSILLKHVHTDQSHAIKKWIMLSMISFFQSYGIQPEFKEPNDIYVGDKKIAGILIESLSYEQIFDVMVIGIGLNINQLHFGDLPATSLSQLTRQSYQLSEMFRQLMQNLVRSYRDHIAST